MEIIKIDANKLGLNEKQANEIETAFAPAVAEGQILEVIYKQLLEAELTPQLSKDAKKLRNKLVKVRTSIGRIHKAEKSFYLAGGKFVDAWKNKNLVPIQAMENKLQDIELHFEKIESERVAKLRIERIALLEPFGCVIPSSVGTMDTDSFKAFYIGNKTIFEQKEAEKALLVKKQAEAEEKEKKRINAEKAEHARIKAENEKLKAEAEAKIKIQKAKEAKTIADAKIESDKLKAKQARAEAEAKAIKDAEIAKLKAIQDEELRQAEEARRKELAEQKRIADKKQAIKDAEIAKLKAEKAKVEARIKADNLRAQQRIQEIEAKAEAEANKSDGTKMLDLVEDLKVLQKKYTFKSTKNAALYSNVCKLITKIINYIKK